MRCSGMRSSQALHAPLLLPRTHTGGILTSVPGVSTPPEASEGLATVSAVVVVLNCGAAGAEA